MAAYLAIRFEKGKLNYNAIFAKTFFASYKDDVDTILAADGYTVNDDGTVTQQ